MHRLILKIKDDKNFRYIRTLLSHIDFIEIEEEKIDNQKSKKSIEVLFGIWKKRNISLQDIRKKAWKVR